MEWLIAAMIVCPAAAGVAWLGVHVQRAIQRRRLLARDPRGAALLERLEAVLARLESSGRLSALPQSLHVELRRELDRLGRGTALALLRERAALIDAGCSCDEDVLRASERDLETCVNDLERLERTLIVGGAGSSRATDLLRHSAESVVHARMVAEEIARLDGRSDPALLPDRTR